MRHSAANSGGEDARRIAAALERIARALEGGTPTAADLDGGGARRWIADANGGGMLHPTTAPTTADLQMLRGLERQILLMDRNTRAFLRGRPSNHALLTGPRGCGKSSVARGVLARHKARLRLIETDAAGLSRLPRLLPALAARRREKFVVYCDDLSFARGDFAAFQRLKSALDGGLAAAGDNVRVYATSNRRRLTAEYFADNAARFADEIRGGETIEEKIALSDRFGLWIPFFDASAAEYERIAAGWLEFYGVRASPRMLARARQWAEERGSANGRMARHFAAAAAAKIVGDE